MARPKTADKAQSTGAGPTTAQNASTGISKSKAIKEALRHLGKKASTQDVIGYIQQKFGLEVSEGYIYLVKSQLKKKRGRKAVGEQQQNGGTELAVAHRGRPGHASCSMSVLRQIKDLSQQAGGMKKLKQLVDLLAD
jgi:hypothetical protein